ncbi:ATP-binding cassette domain-containing protein [bacterium AH-315-K03]|nr:ATP-binding cassette domain-containing protein [bacterium AH-315-K03]
MTARLQFDSIFYSVNRIRVLRGIYAEVAAKTICGIFGRNGSGKSTLLKIGAGSIYPTSGNIFINDQLFCTPSKHRRYQYLAYLPQTTCLPLDIRVSTILKSFPERAKQMVNETRLSDHCGQFAGALSGGECRLLELILVLSLDRPFVLLDEPFSGVEPLIIDQMANLLKTQRSKGAGIVLTDHYYQAVVPLIDTAYFIHDGTSKSVEVTTDFGVKLQQRGYL